MINSTSKYMVHCTYNFTDKDDFPTFSDVISYDSMGTVTAEYKSFDGEFFFQEIIGKVKVGYQDPSLYSLRDDIEDIAKRHIADVRKTLRNIDELQMSAIDSISCGIFNECRNNAIEEQKQIEKDLENREKFNHYIDTIEKRMMHDHYLKLNMKSKQPDDTTPWLPIIYKNGIGIIRDKEWPLESALARLLLVNPYSQIAYPTYREVIDAFMESRRLRLDVITMATDYELYLEDKLVFQKLNDKVIFCDQVLFEKLCVFPEKIWLETVDETFINTVIDKEYVSENCRKKLTKYNGFSISEAIQIESGICGNKKKERQINNEEVDALDSIDSFLFRTIFNICESKGEVSLKSQTLSKDQTETWVELQSKYKYLDGYRGPYQELVYELYPGETNRWRLVAKRHNPPALKKLKKIYKYLSGEIDASNLNFDKQNMPELLKIAKMFDLSISLINCMRATKAAFQRGSYQLREKTLEMVPNFCSFEVFSKTLFHQRIKDVPYLVNAKNWVHERVGLHAKMVANTFILAMSLSDRTSTLRITGARGNTASGKSTALGKETGILNPDSMKAQFRKGTGIRNHQIHLEGSSLFNLCFEEIANKTTLIYTLDLRLIPLKKIKEYLIEPAKKRNCPVILSDFDVPLLTTLNRVLKRDPRGEDPIPSLDAIIDGFKGIREHRDEILLYVEKEDIIKDYALYYLGQIVAKKENGKINVLDIRGYKECLHKPSEEELEICLNRIIDDEYIKEALERGDLTYEDGVYIEQWKGKKVRDALVIHANR